MNNKAQIIIETKNQAGPGVKKAQADLRELGNAAEKTGRRTKESFRQATVSSNSLSGSVSKLYASMAALAALVGAGAIARGFLETAAAMERTKLMLVGLTGSSAKAQESMKWILDFAGKAPYQLSSLSDTFVKLRVAGLDPTAGSMQALVDAVAAFGGSNEQLQRASVAIMQMAGKGVVSMEELRQQLGEAVPDAIHVMAREMGMTVRDLVDMVSKGNLDATTGLTALFEGWAKKHKGAAETFAGSMSGLWNQLKLQYELFKNDMMSSGDSFITIKAALKTTLDLIKKWREDGSIVEWSEYAVKALGVVVETIHYMGKTVLGVKLVWRALETAVLEVVAGTYKAITWLVDKAGILQEKLANIQDFVGFDEMAVQTRLVAAGMRGWADVAGEVASIMIDDIATDGMQGIKDTTASIIALDEKTRLLKEAFYDNVKAMKEQAKAGKAAGSATAEGIETTAKALEKLDPKLQTIYEKLKDFLAIHSQADGAARKIAALNIEYNRMAEQLTDMQLAGLEVFEMSEQLEQWYANSMEDITKKTEETTDKIHDSWSHMYERLQDITADWIYDMKVDFDSVVDLFKRSVAEMISAWIWGQQNMQFASSGQGGFSLGNMFGGLFGGSGAGGAGSTTIDAAGNIVRGTSSAYSLSQAYGAYQTAGGGWGGLKAGMGGFFGMGGGGGPAANWSMTGGFPTASYGSAGAGGGIGSLGSVSWATWAAIAFIAESLASKQNIKHGYGAIEDVGGLYQPGTSKRTSFMGLDMFNEAISTYLRGLVGLDEPTATGYQSMALHESDWMNFLKACAVASWDPLGLVESALGSIGIDLGKIFGYSNKKRSYLKQEYEYGYGLDGGWAETGMVETREKREGEIFREAAKGMSASVVSILNSIEDLTTGFLEIVDEKWVNEFRTAMMDLSSLGFTFDISAEDRGEFESDMNASFSAALEGVINPVVSVAVDFMQRATEEAFTSPEIEKVFGILSDDVATFLRDDMARVLEIFDAPLPTTTAEFTTFMENLNANMEEIGAILGYFQTITAITDEISKGLARSSLTQSLIDINANFLALGEILISVGVDLEKYPDFVKAWGIALAEATYGFSVDNIVQGLNDIMDAPSAMAAAEQFTLGFMEQVRSGMVNSITSAFTEMMYAQMLAPLAEQFLEGAETPEELFAASQEYIAAISSLVSDPGFVSGLKDFGAAMWEINQAIPSAEDLAAGTPAEPEVSDPAAEADKAATAAWEAAGGLAKGILEQAGHVQELLAAGGTTAGDALIAGGTAAGASLTGGAAAISAAIQGLSNWVSMANTPDRSIPEMAQGAVVTKPTYALIGEAGYPEVVLPLGGGHKLTAQLENGGAQDIAITIPVTVITEDGRTLKQETIKETMSQIKERSKRREFVIYASGIAR